MPSRNFYRSLLFLIIIFKLLSGHNAVASNTASNTKRVDELQSLASAQQLWRNPEWLQLLHFTTNSTQHISQVDDQKFFYAADGKINPETEMLATLAAFYQEQVELDDMAQCRFPARLAWLNQKLNNQITDLPPALCALYKEWRASVPDDQLALIFPAYHLNSPSSMFGHTLLRLDAASSDNSSEWLSIEIGRAHV